jgi:hypothetical protein
LDVVRKPVESQTVKKAGSRSRAELARMLERIENEEMPERLLQLAVELQQALRLRKTRQRPN